MDIQNSSLSPKNILSITEALYSFCCERMCAKNVIIFLGQMGVSTDLDKNWRDNVLTVSVEGERYTVEV